MTVHIITTNWLASEMAIKSVRVAVFVKEQNIPYQIDFDDNDQRATHWLALTESQLPVGTARLQRDGHFGRMAVLPDWRSRGIGSLIISAAIDHARKLSLEPLCLNAQLSARPFYQRFGFCSHGPIFMEAGIEHQAMHLS